MVLSILYWIDPTLLRGILFFDPVRKSSAPKQLEADPEMEEAELEAQFHLTESEEALVLFDRMLEAHSKDIGEEAPTRTQAIEKIGLCTKRYLKKWMEWLLVKTHEGEVEWVEIPQQDWDASDVGRTSKGDFKAAWYTYIYMGESSKFKILVYKEHGRHMTDRLQLLIRVEQIRPHSWHVFGNLFRQGHDEANIMREIFEQIQMQAEQGASVARMREIEKQLKL